MQTLTLLISGDARLPLVMLRFIWSETMFARLPLEIDPSEFFWVLGILKEQEKDKQMSDSSDKTSGLKGINKQLLRLRKSD